MIEVFDPAPPCPAGVNRLRDSAPSSAQQPEERDQGLGVLARRDRFLEAGKRPRDDLDPVVLVSLGGPAVGEPGGAVDPDPLVAESRARIEGEDLLPFGSLLADLFAELTLSGPQRQFARDVELARGDLKRVTHADDLTRLAGQPNMIRIEGEDPHRPGV